METFSALLSFCEPPSFSKASDVELWCILWSAPEQKVEQTNDAIALIVTSLLCACSALRWLSYEISLCGAELFVGKIYLYFLSFFNTISAEIAQTLSRERQEPVDFAKSKPWLLMIWQRKMPVHQQSWYCLSHSWIFRFQHQNQKSNKTQD